MRRCIDACARKSLGCKNLVNWADRLHGSAGVTGAAADDAPLGDEELEAGAWGDAELDLGEDGGDGAGEPFADAEGREEGEDGEGGWEMEVRRKCMLSVLSSCVRGP